VISVLFKNLIAIFYIKFYEGTLCEVTCPH
jgi:hypothetical protein